MSKRIISFFLVVTMVMSLFGFSLSVHASGTSSYDSATGMITFNLSGVLATAESATVEVYLGNETIPLAGQEFPASGGNVAGQIGVGVLPAGTEYVIRYGPSATGGSVDVPGEVAPAEAAVTFSAGANGTISAAVGVTPITTGSMQPVGTEVTFTAVPNTGYRVASWTVGGAPVTGVTAATIVRTVAASGLNVSVAFEPVPVVTVIPTDVIVTRLSGNLRPNTGVQFSAEVWPAGASQDVIWEVSNNFGANINISNGYIVIPASAPNGGSITVRATAMGYPNVSGILTVNVTTSGTVVDDSGGGGRIGGILRPGITFDIDTGVKVEPTPPPTREDDEPNWGFSDMTEAYLLYDDVPKYVEGSEWWAHEPITVVSHFGLMHGRAWRIFAPQGNMTRAEFVQVLANMEKVNLASFAGGTAAFNDIDGHWSYPAVQWAQSVGITSGVGDGRFAPNANVTRQEMARLLNNYIAFRNIALARNAATPAFTDAGAISDWATDDVAAIQATGLMRGYPDGSFAPARPTTRAEVAQIFTNFLTATGQYTGR